MKITKDMLISEAIQRSPESIEIMMKYGLHCVGCHVSAFESIEDGAKAHGMSDKEIDEMMKEINHEEDKSALTLSKKAIDALRKELKDTKNGLRISKGNENFITEIVTKPSKDDIVLESKGLRVFIEKSCEDSLKGKRLDFENGDYIIK
ncbi:DUF1858 domain-containing protein [Candidatus Woesearchaeota archaeon]|nr:MAG: DUF1858 domain-containing protein [Candidatus Woesearchaeota archaeon]